MKRVFKILAACVFVCAMAVSCSSPSGSGPVVIGRWYLSTESANYTAAITENNSNYGASIVVSDIEGTSINTIAAVCTKNESEYKATLIMLNGEPVGGTMKIVIQQDNNAVVTCDIGCIATELSNGKQFTKLSY
ncbi:MAG: hypothetical protein KBS84_08625 [Treponema sp.]|nr:hypothetical protein [Candidatus Treponema scatequi]